MQLSGGDEQRLRAMLEHGWRLTPATMGYKITNGKWIPARHLMHISNIVAPALAKGNARIIVTMPARHGKSEFLSVNTSTWFLEHWPEKYVMGISYGLDLATDFSLKVRTNFLNEDLHHLLHTRLRRDKLKIDRFLTTKGGGYTAAGVGGIITGRGADLLFLDDYIKNSEAALSKNQRDAAWEWFKTTAWTRLEPNASVIILATRWDVNDIIGRCLVDMPEEDWVVINLPALAEINDPLGREIGEALWPERYSEEALLKIKASLGSYWWSAMYQQDPKESMSGADLGNYLKYIDPSEVPHYSKLVSLRSWDLAATEGGGDYTCGPKMSMVKEDSRIIIHDMPRFQKSPENTEIAFQAFAEIDGPGIPIWMEQEPGSSGKIVIDHYATEVVPGFSLTGEKPSGKIEVRSQPFLASLEAGYVYAIRGPWNKALKKEINAFPDGDNDDQISSLSLGYNKLFKQRRMNVTWGKNHNQAMVNRRASHEYTPGQHKGIRRLTW